jgi:hypothetical protein
MALGAVSQQTITDTLLEMQSMSPDELESFLGELQDEQDDLPDGHLVSYAAECVRESYDSTSDRRARWDKLWKAHESEMPEYDTKEDWQNAIVLNKPFTTTVQGKAIVRRALQERPDYINIDPTNKDDQQKVIKAKFWEKGLKYWLGTRDVNMPIMFSDASAMGMVVGVSSAVKCLWRPDDNGVYRLVFDNVPPWACFPDPDRKPRKPQEGLYFIQQEWVPLYQLYAMADKGIYDMEKVAQVTVGRDNRDASGYSYEDREDERRRKGYVYQRNRFRKDVLVTEFWGGILDDGTSGRLLMPNARFTVANGVVIKPPKQVPFPRLRWPYMQFSPLPHPLRFDGYGLWEGVMAMWKFQNNVLNMFGDNENWRIQNMYELNPAVLEDTADREVFPGKTWIRRHAADPNQPAVKPVLKGESAVQDVQFIWELATREWEEGSFVTEPLKGQQTENDRTLGELKMKLDQSRGVFDSIGRDIELGGADIAWMAMEVLTTFWTPDDSPNLVDIFGEGSEELMMMEQMGFLMPEQRMQQMLLDADIKITGISRHLDRSDHIEKLSMLITVGDNPRFAMYMKDYDICKRLFDEFNQGDLILSEDEVIAEQRKMMIQAAMGDILGGVDADQQANNPNRPNQPVRSSPGGKPPAKPQAAGPPAGGPPPAAPPPAQ